MESLMASSSAVDRVAYVSMAAKKDGTFLGLDMDVLDNVGAYMRAPEPGCVLRYLGNLTGPYQIGAARMKARIAVTNKSLTGGRRALILAIASAPYPSAQPTRSAYRDAYYVGGRNRGCSSRSVLRALLQPARLRLLSVSALLLRKKHA